MGRGGVVVRVVIYVVQWERAGAWGACRPTWCCGGAVAALWWRYGGGVCACLRDALRDDGGHLGGLRDDGARHVDGGGVGGVRGRAELLRRRVARERARVVARDLDDLLGDGRHHLRGGLAQLGGGLAQAGAVLGVNLGDEAERAPAQRVPRRRHAVQRGAGVGQLVLAGRLRELARLGG